MYLRPFKNLHIDIHARNWFWHTLERDGNNNYRTMEFGFIGFVIWDD